MKGMGLAGMSHQAMRDQDASARQEQPRMLQIVASVSAILLFFAHITGDFFLGPATVPVQALLTLLLVGVIAARSLPRTFRNVRVWPERWHLLGLVPILGLALILRMWGLRFGLPYLEHPDEWAVADRALQMLRSGDYSPHSFIYPTLYTYLQMIVAVLHFLWGVSAGVYRSLADIDPARYYAWARVLTALLGSGAVLLTYAIGRLIDRPANGLIAAALLAVYPAVVGDAHYITTDTPSMFFTVLAFWVIGRLALNPPKHHHACWALTVIAGLSVGLAIATKYNTVVLLAPLVLAVWFAYDRLTRRTWGWLLAFIGVCVGFTLGTPVWLRELPRFLDDVASVVVHYKFTGHPGAESTRPWLDYWDSFASNGQLLSWAFLGGAVMSGLRHRRTDLLLISFVVPYILQMTGLKVVFFRNAMPLLPFLCLFASTLLVSAADLLTAQRTHSRIWLPHPLRHPMLILSGALIVLATQPLTLAIHDDWLRAQPTTRILATEWITHHAPDGSRIWLEDQTLILPSRFRVLGGELVTTHDRDWYRANGFRYLVINENTQRTDNTLLATFGAPSARFTTEHQRHGPTLSIYDTGLADPAQDTRTPSGASLGAGAIVLDGYQHAPHAHPGTTLALALYWRVERQPPQDYTVYVHLLNEQGTITAQRDLPPLDGSLPTTQWKTGDLIRDDQDLALPANIPNGTYQLVVGMYDPKTLVAINDSGPITLGTITISPP